MFNKRVFKGQSKTFEDLPLSEPKDLISVVQNQEDIL